MKKSETEERRDDVRPNNSKPKQNRRSRRSKGKGKTNAPKLEERLNNPAWYYSDERLADQVSQLSFQNLAGMPIEYDNQQFDVPNIVRVCLNPSPGVQLSANYNTALSQHSAINMAGFRLYSKLSAFTGRVQSYAPQDVSTMILAMGEVISMTEFIRRAFGIAYTMNMRNRDYPRQVLNFGMCIDADDFFTHLSDYRTQFNTLIQLFNTIPFPKNVAYFDKCAAVYARIYLDNPSSMAQTLVPVPFTTWTLDEQSYSGGSILSTTRVLCDNNWNPLTTTQYMSVYLNILDSMITALLNSTSLHVVYTDLMNYAAKQGMEFWKMDFLLEGYQVLPIYDANFMLQMHNATVTGSAIEPTFVTGVTNVTPYNDVYPDPNKNSLFYNPAFVTIGARGIPTTGFDVLIDMFTDNPSLTDRVEVTRYAAITKGIPYTTSNNIQASVNAALPDHYVVCAVFEAQTSNLANHVLGGTICGTNFADIAAQLSNIDWAPRIFELDSNNNYTGRYTSDVNFYTTVDYRYLRKLHDFCGLALYDVR